MQIARALAKGVETSPSANELGIEALSEILLFFAADPSGPNWRANFMSRHQVAETALLIEAVAPIVTSWPQGLHKWLAAHRRCPGQRVNIEADFGTLPKRLRSNMTEKTGEIVRSEFSYYLSEEWEGVELHHRSWLYSHAPTRSRIAIREGAELLGISGERLKSMVERDEIAGIFINRRSRTFGTVRKADLLEVKARWSERITVSAAAHSLGISQHQVMNLIQSNFIRAEKTARGWYVSPSDLSSLIDGLACLANSKPSRGTYKTLADVSHYNHFSFVKTVSAILSLHLPVYIGTEPCTSLKDIIINRSDLIAIDQEPTRVTIEEAATELGVSRRVIYPLIESGILKCKFVGHMHRQKYVVNSESLRDFKLRYLFTRDINIEGISSPTVKHEFLLAHGERPVLHMDRAASTPAVWNSSLRDRYAKRR